MVPDHFMRFLPVFLFLISLLGPIAVSGKDFPNGTPLRITTTEIYDERLIPGDGFPGANYQFSISITALVEPEEAILFDENTAVRFSVGNFSFDDVLGSDENFDSTVSGQNRSAAFTFNTADINSDEFQFGRVTVNWEGLNQIRINATFNTASAGVQHFFEPKIAPDYWLWAYDANIDEAPEAGIDDLGFAEVTVGPYAQAPLTYFVLGSSSVTGDDSLVHLDQDGATDGIKPTAVITVPAPATVVNASPLIFEGNVRDRYQVGNTVLNSTAPPSVQYYLNSKNTPPEEQDWLEATVGDTLDAEGNRTWQSPDPVELNPGDNYLFLRAIDAEGNVANFGSRFFKFSTRGQVSITGAATGFPAGQNGNTVGTVAGSGSVFPKAKTISVKANASPEPASDTRTNVEAGSLGVAVAKPGAGAIFNGWTATVDNAPFELDPAEAVKERLTFATRPKLVIIGNFVPNPFLVSGVGTYFGGISGSAANERGTFSGKIAKTGAFSGKIAVGALSLAVKGKFTGSGKWTGIVSKKGKSYTVTLNVTVVSGSLQQITGTIVGEGLDSTLTADLSRWVKKTNEATEYEGTYNVLLPATGTAPQGIGYGRVKISKLGKVKFVGKAGNAAPISFSSVLFERSATEVVFPFFAPVEKKLGNLSGLVTYDSTQTDSDLTGDLTWSKPPTFKAEPGLIDGQIALHGSRFTPPPRGGLVMLAPGVAGTLVIRGPSFTAPPSGGVAFLSASVQLQQNQATGTVPDTATVQKATLKFSTGTGLFTGKFFDPTLRKTFSFSGAASQKANSAGGVFIRGNRAGFVTLDGPP